MRIRIKNEDRVLEGTPTQIVQAMRSLAFGREEEPLGEYIAWVAEQMSRMMEVRLEIRGDTDDAKARSLVEELLRTGFAEQV
jgi:hypothetical protein